MPLSLRGDLEEELTGISLRLRLLIVLLGHEGFETDELYSALATLEEYF